MSSQRRQFRWEAGRGMSALAALGFSLFVGLGMWQLERAAEKTELYASFDAGGDVLPQLPAGLENVRYRNLEIEGHYVANRQILIDNMTHQGRVGYQVLTPLRIAGVDRWLVVNRGWLPAPAYRSELPSVDVGTHSRTISGKLDRLPRPGLRLEAVDEPGGSWPQVMVFPTFDDMSKALGKPLFDYQLLLDPHHSDGFVRDWAPRVMGPDKHRGYALQWFVFALVLVALFIVLNFREVERG